MSTNAVSPRKFDTRRMVQIAILVSVLLVLDLTGFGFVKIPPVSFTIMHIPVIVGAVILGPSAGAFLGGAFGLLALTEASLRATSPVDMAFSPFLSGHPLASLFMTLVPRILLGLAAGYLFKWISAKDKTNIVASIVSAGVATLLHSVLVLGSLWLLFPDLSLVFKDVITAVISLNFLLEMSMAIVFALAFAKVIPAIRRSARRA